MSMSMSVYRVINDEEHAPDFIDTVILTVPTILSQRCLESTTHAKRGRT